MNISIPFFSQLMIKANDLVIMFNTWPNEDAIKLEI